MRYGITAHCLFGRSPFAFYALSSILDFVDAVIVYDVGMDALSSAACRHALKRLDRNVDIDFIKIPPHIVDGRLWQFRYLMREYTKTEYFFIVDSDEVYYSETGECIKRAVSTDFNCADVVSIPAVHLIDLNTQATFLPAAVPKIYRTLRYSVDLTSPEPRFIRPFNSKPLVTYNIEAKGFVHFTHMLNPERYPLAVTLKKPFTEGYPSVLREHISLLFSLIGRNPSYRAALGCAVCPTVRNAGLGSTIGMIPGVGVYGANLASLDELTLSTRLGVIGHGFESKRGGVDEEILRELQDLRS